jgi:RHS repeat-associated protein
MYLAETPINQNYFRDYDSLTGRYTESDPLGLRGGLNTYSYDLSSPVLHRDPLGLDVYVYDYFDEVFGEGHVRLRVNNNGGSGCGCSTYGFYPKNQNAWRRSEEAAGLDVPGVVNPDDMTQARNTLLIRTTPQQDAAVQKFINNRMRNPGMYNLYQRQCTDFVKDALRAAGIPVPGDAPGPTSSYGSSCSCQ